MIPRIFKIVFLFALVGFSTITFQNGTLQTSVNNLTNDSNSITDNSFDVEIFTALIYLLAIFGFAIFILISVVNRAHLILMENFHKSDRLNINHS